MERVDRAVIPVIPPDGICAPAATRRQQPGKDEQNKREMSAASPPILPESESLPEKFKNPKGLANLWGLDAQNSILYLHRRLFVTEIHTMASAPASTSPGSMHSSAMPFW